MRKNTSQTTDPGCLQLDPFPVAASGKTSRCEKSGTFQVSATAYWTVHWTGGGREGDIPLDFTRALPPRITDLRPVLVDPNGDPANVTPPPRRCP
ncbi:hypothetical protein E1263_29725 [Kribbella antibiotica]|uniref:Uncharacterized protein n=1 Tax=Kribbella antibiotica TaxID=190195 RepID=A0A4R4Z266_9ACTN|nr:hypothetical protein [Kribbella antibiotica]TDD51876.1 hypothetical protein E1263_29725 [Kribbella antibiotica]